MSNHRNKKNFVEKPSYTRMRSRINLSLGTIAQQWRIWSSCAEPNYVPNESGAYPTIGTYEYMRDVVVPGFKRRVAKGEKFFNSLWREKYSYQDLGGYGGRLKTNAISCSPNYSYRDNRGNFLFRLLPEQSALQNGMVVKATEDPISNADKVSLQKEVSTRLLNDRGRGETNPFESLAEAHQTVGLFKLLDIRISKLSRLLREAAQAKEKGMFPGYALNGVSNLWLAYRYGIMPLIKDIQAVLEGLKKARGKQLKKTRVNQKIDHYSSSTIVLSYGVTELTVKRQTWAYYSCRSMSLDEVTLDEFDNIGFTGKNLITVPWELVSHSFVADWFVNIGDFLGAITPAFGWNNLGSSLTVTYGVTSMYEVIGSRATGSTYTMDQPANGSARVDFLSKVRQPILTPDIVIKSDFRFDRWTRVADAAALLSKQILKVFPEDKGPRLRRRVPPRYVIVP